MKIGLSQIWVLERMFWKKQNGFAFSFIVLDGGENPNETFWNCIKASWKLVCGFAARLVSAARLRTFPVSYTTAAHFQNQTQEHMLACVLQPSSLCAVFLLDKLLLQVRIREWGILRILTFVCVCTNCKTKAHQNEVGKTWARGCQDFAYWRNFTHSTSTLLSLVSKQWELLLKCVQGYDLAQVDVDLLLPPGIPCWQWVQSCLKALSTRSTCAKALVLERMSSSNRV